MPTLTIEKTGLRCFSGNALKLLAAVSMLIDHIGMILLPQYGFLRILGRLAFPIFAFLIAEGCRYTRRPLRYLTNLFVLSLVCQAGSVIGDGRWTLCVPCSFFLGAAVLLCVRQAYLPGKAGRRWGYALLGAAAAAAAFGLAVSAGIDYGFIGVLLPLSAGLTYKRWPRLILFGVGLAALSLAQGGIQFYGLLALPFLALYNGERGKLPLKWFFYIFYPVHLALLWGLRFCL
ncbi:MAG: TraX family protein [Oscillospiraceae bacterium]|nr:TraX family protein [Oscillospiraceae bacterium]